METVHLWHLRSFKESSSTEVDNVQITLRSITYAKYQSWKERHNHKGPDSHSTHWFLLDTIWLPWEDNIG